MTLSEVNQLVERIRRAFQRTSERGGTETGWEVDIPDFGVQKYLITGVKDFQQAKDDVATLSVWVWSLKDHLKEYIKSKGGDPNIVERHVNSDANLQVCADIANSSKHWKLKNSRSTLYAKLGEVRYSIPQSAIERITFFAQEVKIDVARSQKVEVSIPILDQQDHEIGDALVYLTDGMRSWEQFMARNGVAA